MTYTENYELNQWQKSDRIMMSDFNSDNAKIDAALKANADALATKANTSALSTLAGTIPQFVTGTYVGAGTYGEDGKRTLNLGFQPKLVFVIAENNYISPSGAIFVYPAKYAIGQSQLRAAWSATGISWWNQSIDGMFNRQNETYRYLAIR